MKKILIAAVVIVLLMVGFLLLGSEKQNNVENQDITERQSVEEIESAQEEIINEKQDIDSYQITNSSTASYSAQKRWFNKPVQPVIGTAGDISGQVFVDDQKNTISVVARINPQTIDSVSGGRDNYTDDLFNSEITVNVEDVDFFDGAVFSAPVSITMNGITNSEIFEVNGSVLDDQASFTGTTKVKMSSYGITPPTATSVYTVDDEIILSFDLIAQK